VVGLAVAAFVAALVLHHLLFRYGSGDRDEAVYRYQALLLRDGHVAVPASQVEFYRPWLTGLHAGRLVIPFTLPWAAVLALCGLLFGSPVVALGLVASALTIATYLFTHALLDSRRTALVATALTTLSPFVLALSGTYLNYSLALALELFAAWTLLRGIQAVAARTSQASERMPGPTSPGVAWPWLVASGVLWASAVWCRPLDGVLVSLPFGVWALHQILTSPSDKRGDDEAGQRLRNAARSIGRPAAWLVVGAVPIVVAMLAVNRKATGGALDFPVSAQSGGAARVGWGPRGIYRGELTIDYSLGKAFSSLGHNIAALPTWLVGSYLAVALAGYGAVRLWRRDRAATVLLVGVALVCPIGYLGWFASVLTAPGAFTGIGPHYYLPSVVPLAVLAAVGGLDLWARRPSLAAVGVVVALGVTVVFVVPKVDARLTGSRYDGRFVHAVDRAVAVRGDRPALVVLPPTVGVDGVMRIQDDLVNRPDLSGPVIYALDRGPGLFDLLREQPDRVPFRLTTELRPGSSLATPDPVVQRIRVVSGVAIEVRTTVVSPSADPIVAATIEQAGRIVSVPLDDHATFGRRYQLVWRLHPDGTVDVVVDGVRSTVALRLEGDGEVGIGEANGPDRTLLTVANPPRSVLSFPYRADRRANTIEASTAAMAVADFGGTRGASLPVDVGGRIRITLAAT
jgi:hypothetical protein